MAKSENKTIRVVIINPNEETITERDIPQKDNYQVLREIVRGSIELVRFSDVDMYVNENGRYLKGASVFRYNDAKRGWTVPLIGSALLLKLHGNGGYMPCTLSLDTVRQRVEFL